MNFSQHLQKIVFAFLLILTIGQHTIVNAAEQNQTPVTAQQQETWFMRYCAYPIIAAGVFSLCILTAPDDVKPVLIEQLKPLNLFGSFCKEYLTRFASTLAHEYGHRTAQGLLTGTWSDIHLGTTQTTEQSLFSISHIHLDGLNPSKGYTLQQFLSNDTKQWLATTFMNDYCKKHQLDISSLTLQQVTGIIQSPEFAQLRTQNQPDTQHLAMFLLAGGLTGFCYSILQKRVIDGSFVIDGNALHHLLNALLPVTENSDAARLWKECLGASDSTVNAAIAVAPYVEIAAEITSSYIDPCNHKNSPAHTKLLIGLANYFARGFMHFHA